MFEAGFDNPQDFRCTTSKKAFPQMFGSSVLRTFFLTQCIHEHVCESFNSVRPRSPYFGTQSGIGPTQQECRLAVTLTFAVKSSGFGCCIRTTRDVEMFAI